MTLWALNCFSPTLSVTSLKEPLLNTSPMSLCRVDSGTCGGGEWRGGEGGGEKRGEETGGEERGGCEEVRMRLCKSSYTSN